MGETRFKQKRPWRNAEKRTPHCLCVNNLYLAKETGFWIDFGIRVDTHVKIRKWASKVMGFTVFIHFSKQNAQGATKFKTKRMADFSEFWKYFGNFAAHLCRKKSLKTPVRGQS